ncbi:hypothetical protein TASIC1_0015023300 [Trichoderma asperellum]|uniref:Uncharacterized protein n=1 Tax=Trichoderma asperellum TaxID=101201 RepID=A0A6V8R4S3_TRIAP|nr:hypothetical protein TASIC1_0015023300 [Trichoderma asperellum]
MSDEAPKYPHTMESYIQDDDGDLSYKLLLISNNNNDSNNNNNDEGVNKGTSTEAVQQQAKTVAADSSPISDTGTWEIVDRTDTN